MNAGIKVLPLFMIIFLCLFYALNSMKFGLHLHDHGSLRVPMPDQLRSTALEHVSFSPFLSLSIAHTHTHTHTYSSGSAAGALAEKA